MNFFILLKSGEFIDFKSVGIVSISLFVKKIDRNFRCPSTTDVIHTVHNNICCDGYCYEISMGEYYTDV